MNAEEFEALVRPVALKAQKDALDNGAWISYRNDMCIEKDMFIHEFKDGHKELVLVGDKPGKYIVLKIF